MLFAIRHVLGDAELPLDVQCICPKCRTWAPWVAFESVPSFWPTDLVCGDCADQWAALDALDRAYDDHPEGSF